MLACYTVNHKAENEAHLNDHPLLQAIADEAGIQFEPGFSGYSYLEVPSSEEAKGVVEARLHQNELPFKVTTRIAY